MYHSVNVFLSCKLYMYFERPFHPIGLVFKLDTSILLKPRYQKGERGDIKAKIRKLVFATLPPFSNFLASGRVPYCRTFNRST